MTSNNIGIDKIKQNFKIMKIKNNKNTKSFIFANGKSPLKQKESEEEKNKIYELFDKVYLDVCAGYWGFFYD